MIAPMAKRVDRKSRLLEGLLQALVNRSVGEVAEEAGIPDREYLYAFKNKPTHPLNEENEDLLEAWLIKNDYLDPPPAGFAAREAPMTYNADQLCPECRNLVPGYKQGALACLICGATLGIECPQCGHVNDFEQRFCGSCTAPLTEDAVKQVEKDKQELDTLEPAPKKKKPAKPKKGSIDY